MWEGRGKGVFKFPFTSVAKKTRKAMRALFVLSTKQYSAQRLVPSRYLCVLGVREDWGLDWGARGVSWEGTLFLFLLLSFLPQPNPQSSLTPETHKLQLATSLFCPLNCPRVRFRSSWRPHKVVSKGSYRVLPRFILLLLPNKNKWNQSWLLK